MAIDTPARLAILGAGPIGLEAALYARFLGYDVVVYEQGQVAAAVGRWGHVGMFTPFARNHSPLGLAAIQAQDEGYQPPPDEALLTGEEWRDRYLLPLSQTDLIADHLSLGTTVLAVGKEELLKEDMSGNPDRGDWSFRVLSRDTVGEERVDLFDGALDCSGVFANANWLGHGGIPAIGEIAQQSQIEYRLPDILGRDRPRYAGRNSLVIGAGCSAATNIVALAELTKVEPATKVTWIMRREGAAGAGGPVAVIDNDPLLPRATLSRQANVLATGGGITYWPRTIVERLSRSQTGGPFEVELSGEHPETIVVDEIIANVGFRPDFSLATQLHVHEPNAEPSFYILGSKSAGPRSTFLFTDGLAQIRKTFAILGDRATLDLYASAGRLLR